jgi:succinoglycan biosynthesis protein ExoV
MELYYFKAAQGNVGDDLNAPMWPRLLGDRFTESSDTVFIGIGSVLDGRFPAHKRKVVAGAGARSMASAPRIDESWQILFVRGPLTAHALGLSNDLALSDPALLAPRVFELGVAGSRRGSGLVPYFLSNHEAWQTICRRLSLQLISPHLPPREFLIKLAGCEFVFAEAMHGAILADALGIPWVPLQSLNRVHEGATHHFKWMDYCLSVGVDFNPIPLPVLAPEPRSVWNSLRQRASIEITRRRVAQGMRERNFVVSQARVREERIRAMLARIEAFAAARAA